MRCDRLARRQHWLQRETISRWPDGTVATRYGFVHALYQNVVYENVMDTRKALLHQSIGERIEAGQQGATQNVAAELARHFERAGDLARAVRHLLRPRRV
jgi:predicted ATPase